MKHIIGCLLLSVYCLSVLAQKPAPPADTLRKTVAMDSITVFNTGYQSIAKDRATGSFTQVDNTTLNLQVGSNILNRLESVTGGLAISRKGGSIPPITVRGLSTLNGPTAPLIILDNFPYEGDINAINPNLVESVTILKDATAASIWGTRAGNGVIVINTKKGKFSQPVSLDFSSTVQMVSKPDLYRLHTIAPSDYIDVEQLLFSKGYYNSQLSSASHPNVSPVVDLLDRQARGLVSAAEVNSRLAAYRNTDIKNDLQDSYYANALNQQYALSFSGGTVRSSCTAGGGYDYNLSGLQDKIERKSFRVENNFVPFPRLKFSTGVYFTSTDTKTGKDDYTNQEYIFPYSSLYAADGKPVAFGKTYRLSYTDTLGRGKLMDWGYYPTEDYKYRYIATAATNLIVNIGAQYTIGKGFSADLKYQSEQQHTRKRNVSGEQSYNARYYVNLFSQINAATGVVTYNVPQGGILDMTSGDIKVNNYRAQVNYNRRFAKHRFTALAGNEIREIRSTEESYRTYGYNTELGFGTVTDMKNRYPIVTTGELALIPGGDNTFSDGLKRYVSFFANAAWTYDDKYTLNMSGRRDASNLFGVTTNDKWTPLWSAGASWLLSGEKFYHSGVLPVLKLRATWGYTGNADPSRSAVLTVASVGTSSVTGLVNYRIRQYPNPELRWEQVAIGNIGIDFVSRNNRISGSIEYYRKKGIDLFASALVDQTVGILQTGIIKNVAAMTGKGMDIAVNTVNTVRGVRWTTGIIVNYNTDRVSDSYLSNTMASFYVSDGANITPLVGRPVHSVMSFRSAGLDHATGSPQGYLDGKPSMDYAALTGAARTIEDLEYSGPGMPQCFGSVTNEISWKKFALNFNVSYKLGYYFKRKPLNYLSLFSNDRKSTADFAARWQQPGDEAFTDIPSFVYPVPSGRDNFYVQSASIVEKGDHIRLQFINLSYRFSLRGKAPARTTWSLQCFANAANLGILWRANKEGLDPDYPVTVVPPSKTFAAGIKLFFQ